MFRRFFYNLGLIGLFVTPVLLAVLAWGYFTFIAPKDRGSKETISFSVEKDWNAQKIAQELEAKGLLDNWWSVYYLSKNKEIRIVAGEYALSPSMTPAEILEVLRSGKLVEYQISIPRCATVEDVISLIVKENLVNEKELRDAARNQALMAKSGVPSNTPEGYLLEGVYSFSKPIAADKLFLKIIEQSQRSINDTHEGWQIRATKLGLRPYEVLTLASMVEKETAVDEERGKIASVFFNRLKLEMPLESRPALAYGLTKSVAQLTEQDLSAKTAYNTFKGNKGLPPSPLCSPSHSSIKAVLYPEVTDYLYFVTMPDSTHEFASTARQYQLLLTEAKTMAEAARSAGAARPREPSPADINSVLSE